LLEVPCSLREDIKVAVEAKVEAKVKVEERQGKGCMNILPKRGDHGRSKRV
jgi:hypothetical protein